MSDLLVYVIIAAVAIAGAAAWLYFPSESRSFAAGRGADTTAPPSLALSRHKANPGRCITGHN
jgi:hypothetical protein